MHHTPPIPQFSRPKRNRAFVWILISCAAIAIVTYGTVWWLQEQITENEFTSDTTRVQIIIGNDVVKIPANMIRFQRQRSRDTVNQVDLLMLWPNGDGYTSENKSAFLETGENQELIFMTLLPRKIQLDMDGRLAPIYLRLFVGETKSGPSGLTFQALRRGTGYDGETLALFANDAEVWVARCQDDNALTIPTCLRDIHIGRGLSLRYRFPRKMLKNWREIEKLVRRMAHSFLNI
ncbi:MAG: hypothetical protein COC23_07130 [Hyphomicrobiales bacterium]|nr:MAG: hypothetical protein COC23_07130 [Hyphomicrobiales bacterium]